jgi:hypothetical protein
MSIFIIINRYAQQMCAADAMHGVQCKKNGEKIKGKNYSWD